MSRRRIQLEGSLPWDPALVSEAMMGLFSKVEFLPYEEAKEFVRNLNLKNFTEWRIYCKSGKKPNYIPGCRCDYTYNDKWKGWGDFLGTGNIHPSYKNFLSFKEARKFVRSLNLNNFKEWREYCRSGKRPDNMPSSPEYSYKDAGWTNWYDFLGIKGTPHQRNFLSFKEARKFVRSLNLNNFKEWREYCRSGKRPDNMPYDLYKTYRNKGWTNWGDFLGTGNRKFLSFKEAQKFVRKLKMRSKNEWHEYCRLGKRPRNIPSNPYQYYKNKGWIDWYDFLGKNP